MATDPDADPAARYVARAERYARARDAARRRAGHVGTARLAVALALVGVGVLAAGERLAPPAAAALGGAGLLAFVALVLAHGRARGRERAAAVRHAAAVDGAARLRRDWAALPVPAWGAPPNAPWPPLADDLHLFARASLAQLLDVVTPLLGGPRLAAWLVADPPDPAALRGRQAAVRALAHRAALLEDCAALARDARTVPPRAIERLLAWAEAPPDGRAARLRAAAWVGPLLTLAALGAGLAGAAPLGATLAVAIAFNLSAVALAQRPLRALLAPAAGLSPLLGPVLALLARVEAEPFDARALGADPHAPPVWRAIQARLRRAGGAAAGVRRLGRWAAWAEVRQSPMLHWALAATLAWDAAIVAGLEGWRRSSGAAARDWFDALADAEALVALATLAQDHPTWAFPELLSDAPPSLAAHGLAHPLLPDAGRVGNDVCLGGAGSLLVVSGSNMAGKTTLLRALGVNALLAQAGAPVCAAAMRWRPLRVRTSVRVHDALDAGVSLFLAELRRIQGVVAAAEAPDDAPVLYLFDEVLHGTNSADRRVATRAVLARLHASGAVGVVTTHDVELAAAPDLAPAAAHVHFREAYAAGADGPRMTFDYVARPGPATTANALALLALLGLESPRPRS